MWKTSGRVIQACRLAGSDDGATTISSATLEGTTNQDFIGGNKRERPIGDEEFKFIRNVNGSPISSPDGGMILDLR